MSKKDFAWLFVVLSLGLFSFKMYRNQEKSAFKGNPVVHFEVGCKDLPKLKDFYSHVFGWTPTNMGPAENFNTNSSEGIQGHLTALGHEPFNYVTFYIQVDDIQASLNEIANAGGKKILGPFPLPDKRKFAWFSDPEGNMIGLITPLP